jgi:hypothetical protein
MASIDNVLYFIKEASDNLDLSNSELRQWQGGAREAFPEIIPIKMMTASVAIQRATVALLEVALLDLIRMPEKKRRGILPPLFGAPWERKSPL